MLDFPFDEVNITVVGADYMIRSYIQDYDVDNDHYRETPSDYSEIDTIFNR